MMKSRLKSDGAGAITILGYALVFVVLLMSIFMVDFFKNIHMKGVYLKNAQHAVQSGLRAQNHIGGLLPSSANVAKDEYMRLREYSQAFRAEEEGWQNFPIISIYFDRERHPGLSPQAIGPYMSQGGEDFRRLPSDDHAAFYHERYAVLSIEVKENVDNYFWGWFAESQSIITVRASAVLTKHYDK